MDENVTPKFEITWPKTSEVTRNRNTHLSLVIILPRPDTRRQDLTWVWLIFSSDHDPAQNGRGSEHSGIVHASLNTEALIQTQLSKFVRMWSWLGAEKTHLPMTLPLFVKPRQFKVLAHQNYPRWRKTFVPGIFLIPWWPVSLSLTNRIMFRLRTIMW